MSDRMRKTLAYARNITIVLLIVIAASLAFWAPTPGFAKALAVPSAQELSNALYRAGLDPESLTASGVTSNAVAAIVDDVRTEMTNNPGALASADQGFADAKNEVDRLTRLIRAGKGTPQDVTSLNTEQQALNTATTNRQAVLNDLIAAGITSLAQAPKDLLATIRGNQAWGVPIEFRTVTRTEADWLDLRSALANERIANNNGATVDQNAQQLLATERSDPTIAQAIANLDANLAGVTNAWNTEVFGQ